MKYTRLILIVLVGVIFYCLMVFVECNLILADRLEPQTGMKLEQWLDKFKLYGAIGILLATVAGVLWYVLGEWILALNDWRGAGKREIWLLNSLLALFGVVVSILFLPTPQEGGLLADIFLLLNPICVFYIGTALFTPPSYKYTPIGARAIRRWR